MFGERVNKMNEEQQASFQQAKELLAKEQWQPASEVLEGLVNDVDSPVVGRLTIIALYHAKQYTRACSYLFEYLDLMVEELADAQIAVDIFVQNELFILARQVVNSLPEWRAQLMPLIEAGEQRTESKYQETMQTQLRDFYHLGDYPLPEQQSRLQAAFKLPLAEFLTGAKFLLRDPFTHPLVKSSLVELLCKLRVNEQVTYYWLDKKEYPVVPTALVPLKDHPLVIAGKREINHQIGDQNPQTAQAAVQEFQLQVMFLYPRLDAVITDIDVWVDLLIARLEGQKISVPTRVSEWQERLATMIDELIEKH